MSEFVQACPIEEVPEGRGKAMELNGVRVGIFRHQNQFYALFGRCPHANAPLGRGWIEDGEVVCPLHRWRFRLKDGRCSTVPGESVHRFECVVREGAVWVAVE